MAPLPFLALPPEPGGGAPLALAVLASYLLGGVPFGWLLARGLKGIDLRKTGSGNIGATNAMRALGRGWGVVAFLLDFAKGAVPVALFAPRAGPAASLEVARLACGAAAVLGHCFPVYLRFRGGKGVATGCGAIAAVDPWVLAIGAAAWLLALLATGFVGLSSMVMGVVFPVAAWIRHPADRPFLAGCALLALLVLVRHRKNIARMLAGTEPRTGRRKRPGTSHG